MSIYWKQSLWLGGLYWLISLVFTLADTFETYMADFILSMLLTLFLIPMNFIKPVKWIEKTMNKLPIFSTFLTAVGWVPYISISIFLLTTIYAVVVIIAGYTSIDGIILKLITPLTILTVVKNAGIIFSFIIAAFLVLVYKKSVAGCLNNKFKLVEGNACNLTVVEEAVAEHAKKMYKCKKEVTKRAENEKKMKEKKKAAKKIVKEKQKEEKAAKKKD